MLPRFIVLVFIFCSALFGVNLTSIVSTQEPDNIKFVLNFDASFDGHIEQNKTAQGVLFSVSNLSIVERKDFLFENSFVQKAVLAQLKPMEAVLFVEASNELNYNIVKTSDGMKITIVVTPRPAPLATSDTKELASKDSVEDMFGWRYAVVIVFMVFLITILFIVKKKMQNGSTSAISSLLAKNSDDRLKIVSQRFIDNSNKLVLLEYEDAKYLILVGSSSLVIDKFYDNVNDITDADLQKALSFTHVSNNNKQQEKHHLSDFDDYRLKAEGEY